MKFKNKKKVMTLTAEQIHENWEKFLGNIETYISEPRRTKLLEMYEKYADRLILMPAANKKEYHNCMPGGYIDHVNRVVEAAIKLDQVWKNMGVDESTYTLEELVFSAINHDLGKMGDEEHDSYITQDDQWRRDKLGEEYKFNDKLEYMSVPDRSLRLLITNGVEISKNEWLGIKLHDGLYEESNKSYLMSWSPETKPRTSLIYIIHQADILAARVEFEREWNPKIGKSKPKTSEKKTPIKTKALASIKSEGLTSAMNDFFKD